MKERILVVDDQQEWIDFLKNALPEYELEVAENTPEALLELQEDDFDLIIANIRRLDLLQAIAEEYPDKDVVVMTVSPTTREAATVYSLGALDYFPRSFSPQVIISKIENALQIARKRRSLVGTQSAF